MRAFLLWSALSLMGLAACVEARESAPTPAPTEEPEAVEAEPEAELVGNCCIDYTCAANGYSTTGCKTGSGPSIREAFEECRDACPGGCTSSGLYCQ